MKYFLFKILIILKNKLTSKKKSLIISSFETFLNKMKYLENDIALLIIN